MLLKGAVSTQKALQVSESWPSYKRNSAALVSLLVGRQDKDFDRLPVYASGYKAPYDDSLDLEVWNFWAFSWLFLGWTGSIMYVI